MKESIWDNKVRSIKTEKEIKNAFPVVQKLRTHLDEKTYISLVKEAMEKDNYKMWGLYSKSGELLSVVGYKYMVTLYYGRFIWICDLVTKKSKRSNGYGEHLLAFVEEEIAEKQGIYTIALSSGLKKIDAHRFYESHMGYKKVSYVFKKELAERYVTEDDEK